jgi:hypothetical protein
LTTESEHNLGHYASSSLQSSIHPSIHPSAKLNKQNSSLDILSSQTAYSYNIDTGLSYKCMLTPPPLLLLLLLLLSRANFDHHFMCGSLPLDEFLEQYYKDYPESLADLTIYQVCYAMLCYACLLA